jgi:hypothetical protein
MPSTIDPSAIFSGAPVSILFGGVECGATTAVPKLNLEVEAGGPEFTNAGGPVKSTRITRKIIPSVELTVNEMTAQKIAWALPGATATSSSSVGQPRAGLDTTLAADPALGATNVKVTSVTTVAQNDFVRIGAAGVAATEANSEVVKVTTVGTSGGGGTGLDVENSAGGGLLIDHANGAEIKTVTGTILAAPAAAGATNIKVDSVTGLTANDYVRIGYVGHYETRQLTAVGTTGPSGTGLTFAVPLTRDHGLDEWVIEVTALGGTTIRPVIGRIASAAYQDLVLTDMGADGATMIVTLENAMSAESQELSFDDDPANPLGLTLKFTGHYSESTPTQVPLTIQMS